jgi:hypothetical protein
MWAPLVRPNGGPYLVQNLGRNFKSCSTQETLNSWLKKILVEDIMYDRNQGVSLQTPCIICVIHIETYRNLPLE